MRPPLRLNERAIIFALLLLFVSGVVFTMWHLTRLQSQLNESSALEHAKLYSEAITEFRTLYTQEVVETARDRGIVATHDYKHREGAIPLPATLSMLLGRRIGDLGSGARTRLYSAYPFPWREEENQRLFQDPFARNAWEYWQQNPDSEEPFYRFEEFEGRLSFRYAVADRMRASCVDCHNSHPDTPKNDWSLNDVRGVLEIITPMDIIIGNTQAGLRDTFLLMGVMTVVGLIGLVLVIDRFRRTASILETRVKERTAELSKANTLLRKNAIKRARLEAERAERTAELDRKNHQLGQALKQLEDELEIAKQMQLSILPAQYPDREDIVAFGEMVAAREVGGDFYDIIEIDRNRIGFVIADVSGKGVPAALFMAVSCTIMKSTALRGGGPGEVLERVNQVLSRENESSMFVTLFYGIIDIRSDKLTYANAGHNPPYMIGPDNSVSPLEGTGGVALGVVSGMQYVEKSVTLREGDTVFCYTDGVVEAMDPEGHEFGNQRLRKVLYESYGLSVEALSKRVIDNVSEFADTADQFDDITCVVFRYQPPVPSRLL